MDKTLLNTDKNIPPENVLAIKELKSNHILPVISTGKNLYEMKEIVNSSGINTIIGANGSDLVFRGQHVYQLPIGQAQINRLCNQANIDNIAIGFHNDKGIAITKRNKYTESLFDEMRRPQPPVDPDFYKNNVVTMLLVFIPTTLEGTILEKKYKLKFPELHFMRNSDITIDTVNTGVSKAYGINILLHRPELSGIHSFAFGDGNNDISMLRTVDTGIAMGNASSEVKKIADYQTDDYQHAGIPKALKHFGLI